jgi:hypothetical protein
MLRFVSVLSHNQNVGVTNYVSRCCKYLKAIRWKTFSSRRTPQKMGSVFERYGANIKTTNFVAGRYTECIGLLRSYPDFKTAHAALVKAANDPEGQKIRNLRETDPAGEMVVSREVRRTIFW